jgi:hypothetical protein
MSEKTIIPNSPVIRKIPVGKLRPAPWNYKYPGTPEQMSKLKNSILSTRSAGVLCVRALPKNLYEVIDGNHRLEAVLEAGWTHVHCEDFGKISIAQSVIIARQRNYQWFDDDESKLGELYTEQVAGLVDRESLISILPDDPIQFDSIMDSYIKSGTQVGKNPDPENGGEYRPSKSINVTIEQSVIIDEAIERVREDEDDVTMSEGRCLELICADYLAGN